jgi:hypothetical protein
MRLASKGAPCLALPGAIRSLLDIDSWEHAPDTIEPDVTAGLVVGQASKSETGHHGMDVLVGRLLQGSKASGNPWPGREGEEGPWEMGRVVSVLSGIIDFSDRDREYPEDCSASLGGAITREVIAGGLRLVDAGLGDVDPADAMAQLIDSTDPEMLSKAVQCAELLGELAGALGTHDESREEQHWQNVAAFVPPSLLFASLFDRETPGAGMDMLLEILTSPAAGAARERYLAARRGSDELTSEDGTQGAP